MISNLLYTKVSGSYVALPNPSSYSISYEDLDNESYRSVVNGNLIRDRIKPRWVKLSVEYNGISADEVNTIASAINSSQEYDCKIVSPAFGTSNYIEFTAYTSKFQAEMLDAQVGWNLSFNIVQSQGGSFQ